MALDPLIINRDDSPKRTRCTLSHGGSFLLFWLRLATTSSARFGAAQPYSIVRKILYVISTKARKAGMLRTQIILRGNCLVFSLANPTTPRSYELPFPSPTLVAATS